MREVQRFSKRFLRENDELIIKKTGISMGLSGDYIGEGMKLYGAGLHLKLVNESSKDKKKRY